MAQEPAGTLHPQSFISPESRYGLLRAATPDRTVWLYGRIPWSGPLTDGANNERRAATNRHLTSFFDGLAGLVTVAGMKYRSMLRGQYREFHLLTAAMPVPFDIPPAQWRTDLGRYLLRNFTDVRFRNQKQFAVIGVPLQIGRLRKMNGRRLTRMERFMFTWDKFSFSRANGMAMFEEYLDDAERIENIMLASGIEPFSRMDPEDRENLISDMQSWWVSRAHATYLPVMYENDHMHLFDDVNVCRTAQNLYDDNVPCSEWNIPGSYLASVCFAQKTKFQEMPADNVMSQWIARLMDVGTAGGGNSVGVSVRGIVEPSDVTSDQIRRNGHALDDSIRERYKHDHEASDEMIELKDSIDYQRSVYRYEDSMPPTLINLSISVLAAGKDPRGAVESLKCVPQITFMNPTTSYEQMMGFKSMQACSPIRMSPYERELTAPTVAGAGAGSFARAGDPWGALLGQTEANRQNVYISNTATQDKDKRPAFIIVGTTGSGKTMALISLIGQFSMIDARDRPGEKIPVILIDPKEGSDYEDYVLALGGKSLSIDSDIANGEFDTFNVMPSYEQAKETTTIMLSNILGPEHGGAVLELTLPAMLDFGHEHGAKSTGVAIEMAYQAYMRAKQAGQSVRGLNDNVPMVRNTVFEAVAHNQLLRIIIGTSQETKPLKAAQGLTYIKAGRRSLVPSKDADQTMTGRIQRWVLRMITMGAGTAVSGRDGIVAIDEAWMLMGDNVSVIDDWMRTARQRRFAPYLASQKVQEFVDAGMVGGISRALLLSLTDPREEDGVTSPARAALRLMEVNDTSGMLVHRMPIESEKDNGEPNWESLQRLKRNGRTIRGSVGYFVDGSNPPVPVEITIPDQILKKIDNNALAAIRRQRQGKAA